MELIKVTFEPHNQSHTKVTALRSDGAADVVYLDNVSAKHFLRQAMMLGTGVPPTWNGGM